jgi:alkaline phosphatase D
MSVGRREFIIGTLGGVASSQLLTGCDSSEDAKPLPDGGVASDSGVGIATLPVDAQLFAHGVASGDPLQDRVILWTRLNSADGQPAELSWALSSDAGLTNIVQQGTAAATAERDYTVKVDVTGLTPGTTYYYAFALRGRGRTVTGRTRTLPVQADRSRIAFTSCANYQYGYFNAYRAIAKRNDLDLWIHLGDYIYEYAEGVYQDPLIAPARPLAPATETITLADYRARYGHYRKDPDLQEVHRQHPLIAVWDDHEFANNAYVDGAQNHAIDGSEGDWGTRKQRAAQAFLEWLPIRVADPSAAPVPRIFRTFSFGDLFDLIMLDTRIIARAEQAGGDTGLGTDVGEPSEWVDPQRQLLGSEQEAWFLGELTASKDRAVWRLIGNQVTFAQTRSPFDPTKILFSDFWDGYQPARQRVIDHIVSNGIHDIAFLTGDIHSSWAMEVNANPFVETPPAPFAVELVGPSVTSEAYENQPEPTKSAIVGALEGANKHVRFGEVTQKGYVLIDLTRERLQAEWYFVNRTLPNDDVQTLGFSATCQRGTARLIATTAASTPNASAPASAPLA